MENRMAVPKKVKHRITQFCTLKKKKQQQLSCQSACCARKPEDLSLIPSMHVKVRSNSTCLLTPHWKVETGRSLGLTGRPV